MASRTADDQPAEIPNPTILCGGLRLQHSPTGDDDQPTAIHPRWTELNNLSAAIR